MYQLNKYNYKPEKMSLPQSEKHNTSKNYVNFAF